jgi:hypothetical protein
MTVIIDGTAGITFPVTAGSASAVQASSGRVLQVVQAVKTDNFSTTSSSFTNITGISASITPSSSSSKILVMVSLGAMASANNVGSSLFRFTRGGTAIGVSDAVGSRPQATFRMNGTADQNTANGGISYQYLDSPATTSSTTYALQVCCQSGGFTVYINSSYNDANTSDTYGGRTASSITLMEISA